MGNKKAVRDQKDIEMNRTVRAHSIMAPSPNVQLLNIGPREGVKEGEGDTSSLP